MAALQAGYLFPEVRGSLDMFGQHGTATLHHVLWGHDVTRAALLLPHQVAKRRRAHQEKNPNVRIISLGIGDTTEPIPAPIAAAMEKARHSRRPRALHPSTTSSDSRLPRACQASAGLGTVAGYSGYGAEQGQTTLREALAKTFYPVRHICFSQCLWLPSSDSLDWHCGCRA